jgi:cytoskeletal protein CcmA (bactofilin family)
MKSLKLCTQIAPTLLFFVFFLAPLNVANSAIVQTSPEISLSADQNFSENTYFISNRNNIEGQFERDLFLTGVENTFKGNVSGDLFVVGGNNYIQGEVDGDLRIIGGAVYLKGKITGDLLVFGGQIYIEPEAVIEGQSIFVGGKIFQNAPLNQKTKIYGAIVNLNSELNSGSEITAQTITAEKNTKINAVLTYYSPKQIIKKDGSSINAELKYNQISNLKDSGFFKKAAINLMNFWILLKFITTLILAFVLVYIFRIFTTKTVELALKHHLKSFFTGILLLILIPILIPILIISLIGLPIGFMLILIFILALFISVAMAGIMAGALIRKLFSKNDTDLKIDFNSATLGVFVLTFISFVPLIGPTIKIIFDLIVLGAMFLYIKKQLFN